MSKRRLEHIAQEQEGHVMDRLKVKFNAIIAVGRGLLNVLAALTIQMIGVVMSGFCRLCNGYEFIEVRTSSPRCPTCGSTFGVNSGMFYCKVEKCFWLYSGLGINGWINAGTAQCQRKYEVSEM